MRHILFLIMTLALSLTRPKLALASLIEPESLQPVTAEQLKALLETRKPGVNGTVVNFWATSCASCKTDLPKLLKLQKQFASRGLRLILVSADASPSLPEAENYLKEILAPLPSFRLGEPPAEFGKKFDSEWPIKLPVTYMYDDAGKKISAILGPIHLKTLESNVTAFLPRLASKEKIGSDLQTDSTSAQATTPRKTSEQK